MSDTTLKGLKWIETCKALDASSVYIHPYRYPVLAPLHESVRSATWADGLPGFHFYRGDGVGGYRGISLPKLRELGRWIRDMFGLEDRVTKKDLNNE